MAFEKQLMRSLPDESVLPYYHAENKHSPYLKRMFYERFKAKIFTKEELKKIAEKEKGLDEAILELDENLQSPPSQSPPPVP